MAASSTSRIASRTSSRRSRSSAGPSVDPCTVDPCTHDAAALSLGVPP